MFVLLGLSLFHVVNNFIILVRDTVPVSDEIAGHFYKSLQVYSWGLVDKLFITEFDYPPLFYWSSLPLYWLFGKDQDVAAMTNVLYIFILIFSVYGIGKELRGPAAGLLSSFIVSTFIAIYGFSRIYMLEFAMTAMAAMCIYFLIKSRGFEVRLYSVLFGFACGLGLLVKFSLPVYIMGPVVYYVFKGLSFRHMGNSARQLFEQKGINILMAFVILATICSPWYAINLKEMSNRTKYFSGTYRGYLAEETEAPLAEEEKTVHRAKSRLTFANLSYYISVLYGYQIGYFYFGLFLVGFLYHLFFNRERPIGLLLWFLIPIILFTCVHVLSTLKEPRFIMPYLSSVGIMIALAVSALKWNRVKVAVSVMICIVGLHQFFSHSYGNHPFFGSILLSKLVLDDTHQRPMEGMMKSEKDQWKSKEITRSILESFEEKSNCTVMIALYLNFGKFALSDLEMNVELYFKEELAERGIRLEVEDPYGYCGMGSCILKYSVYRDIIEQSDIVVLDNSEVSADAEDEYGQSLYLMMKSFQDLKDRFELIEAFSLPKGNIISVYRKISAPPVALAAYERIHEREADVLSR